jgi:hypothetical protein
MKRIIIGITSCLFVLVVSCSEDGNTERDPDFDPLTDTTTINKSPDTQYRTARPSDTSQVPSGKPPGSDNPTSKDIQGQPYQPETDTPIIR